VTSPAEVSSVIAGALPESEEQDVEQATSRSSSAVGTEIASGCRAGSGTSRNERTGGRETLI
jgi:hypothetical protein